MKFFLITIELVKTVDKNFRLCVYVSKKYCSKIMNSENEKTLRNLCVLASLSQNDKLNTKDDYFVIYVPTHVRGVIRFVYGENREYNIQRIRQCIRDAKQYISSCMNDLNNSSDEDCSLVKKMDLSTLKTSCFRMTKALNNAKDGLQALQMTYKDDATCLSSIVLMINEIDDYMHATRQVFDSSPTLARFKLHE